jgi:hypothetical protein
VSRGTWVSDPGSLIPFSPTGLSPSMVAFPDVRLYHDFVTSRRPELLQSNPHNPAHTTLQALHMFARFGLFPVRSPLLRKSLLFSLPEGTKMFQFPSFASLAYVFS